MKKWPVQDAKASFCELLETCLSDGPQVVTKREIEAAVIVPMREWQRLKDSKRPSLKELLLAPTPKADLAIPSRKRWRQRKPVALD